MMKFEFLYASAKVMHNSVFLKGALTKKISDLNFFNKKVQIFVIFFEKFSSQLYSLIMKKAK